MIYCFWLAADHGGVLGGAVAGFVELFDGVYQAGRWPVGIYPGWLRVGLTFLVPLAFAVTVPAEALTSGPSVGTLLGAAASRRAVRADPGAVAAGFPALQRRVGLTPGRVTSRAGRRRAEMTSTEMTRALVASTPMSSFARPVSGIVSVGLNAVELVSDT